MTNVAPPSATSAGAGDDDVKPTGAAALSLGLPDVLSRARCAVLHEHATRLFEAVYGPSGDLAADLEACAVMFNPVAQGKRLRDLIAALPELPSPGPCPDRWLLRVGDDKHVLTPEGVAGLHALRACLSEDGETVLPALASRGPAGTLLDQYKEWNEHRIRSVVGLLRGEDKPLQVQAAGVVIALLVNDSTSPDRAVRRFAQGQQRARDDIDRAFFAPVQAFTVRIAPGSKTRSGGSRLISGWPLGEVARRLGGSLLVTKEQADRPGLAYIAPGRSDDALRVVARDLARGNRRRPTPETLEAGFLDLVSAFREQRGVLAGYGQLHEDPPNTERLRYKLLDQYRRALSAGTTEPETPAEPA